MDVEKLLQIILNNCRILLEKLDAQVKQEGNKERIDRLKEFRLSLEKIIRFADQMLTDPATVNVQYPTPRNAIMCRPQEVDCVIVTMDRLISDLTDREQALRASARTSAQEQQHKLLKSEVEKLAASMELLENRLLRQRETVEEMATSRFDVSRCPNCGNETEKGLPFCIICGEKLGDMSGAAYPGGVRPVAGYPPHHKMVACPAPPMEQREELKRANGQLIPLADGEPLPPTTGTHTAANAPVSRDSATNDTQVDQKKERKGLFGGLFGRKKGQQKKSKIDDVQFRAAAPASIRPGEYFTVKVMMYLESDYARADREQQSLGEKVKSASSGVFQAQQDQKFRIVLQSPDIPLTDCDAMLCWNGKYAATDLDVLLPENYDKKQVRLHGRVYSGAAVLTDVRMILQVDMPQAQEVTCEKCILRSAFISYASADRAEVASRIQGIQLAAPDMDLFFDVESLRRGERWEPRLYREIRDRQLFYLFWSRNAANSKWVSKELAYAVEHKGLDYIEPVPLESPDLCPPPAVLNDRHFNDWTLRYLNK